MKHLITGGAGFIGCNLADALLRRGDAVTVLDNLSRPLTPLNLEWLRLKHKGQLTFVKADIRDMAAMREAIATQDVVFHLAGQVAVTTSVEDPLTDFDINARGTLNVLEAARQAEQPPIVFFSSTNKVYGGMDDVALEERETRYVYRDLLTGVSERQPLDFHSPYGCSKGAADQYVRDYARIFGLRTVVFRQGCIYGPRQFGVEDQGWAAHFVIAAMRGDPITIYGDGKQVRDMLYVADLVNLYLLALDHIGSVSGDIFNVGGGPENTLSVWTEFCPLLQRSLGDKPVARFADWRPGDQRVYISDIRKAGRELGWVPQVGVEEGIERLVAWVRQEAAVFQVAARADAAG